MLDQSKLSISAADENDGQEILSLQRLAYRSESKNYNDFPIRPLVETIEEWNETFKTHVVLKVTVDGKIIGSVRVLEQEGTCHIGRLMVHPDLQNQGIGTRLLLEIERRFSSCSRFELFTGSKSKRSLHLYEKLGYKAFKNEEINDDLRLVFLEKLR